jgi:hypothetical protein
MCTKWFSDGDVHKHFSPYATPHEAFIAFLNALDDLRRRASAPVRRPRSGRKATASGKRRPRARRKGPESEVGAAARRRIEGRR